MNRSGRASRQAAHGAGSRKWTTALLIGRAQRDAAVAEGPAELDRPVAEAQPAARVDPAHDSPGTVVKLLDLLRQAALARAVARRRGRQTERVVRPLRVVHQPPFVKPAPALAKIGKGAPPGSARACRSAHRAPRRCIRGRASSDQHGGSAPLDEGHSRTGVSLHLIPRDCAAGGAGGRLAAPSRDRESGGRQSPLGERWRRLGCGAAGAMLRRSGATP